MRMGSAPTPIQHSKRVRGLPDFRRWYEPGATYFFTIVTYQRWPLLKDPEARRLLGSVMRQVKREQPFETIAIVLLWDHLHCVWALPRGDSDFSIRWSAIKRTFTKSWLGSGGSQAPITLSQETRHHRGIWQPRFWEHRVRDENDLERCCDYIHYDPVKHHYVQTPWDWPYSSFRRQVSDGQYPPDWGRSEPAHLQSTDWE